MTNLNPTNPARAARQYVSYDRTPRLIPGRESQRTAAIIGLAAIRLKGDSTRSVFENKRSVNARVGVSARVERGAKTGRMNGEFPPETESENVGGDGESGRESAKSSDGEFTE